MVAAAPPAVIAAHARGLAVRGTVLAIDERTGVVRVRHSATRGMPAMSMDFRLGAGAPAVHPGDTVTAVADAHTEPWTLIDVRVFAPAPAAANRPYVPTLHEGDAVPDVSLIGQDGRAFSLHSSRGAPTIVSFIYTRCADARMCPLVAAKFARMQRASRGMRLRLVTITLDPLFDTPRVLKRYGAAYGADARVWTLATGSPAAVDELAARFGIALDRPSPGIVAHTEAAIVIGADNRIATIVDGAAWSPDDLLDAVRQAAGADTSFVQRVRFWFAGTVGAVCGRAGPGITAGAVLLLLAACAGAFALIARRAFRGPEEAEL